MPRVSSLTGRAGASIARRQTTTEENRTMKIRTRYLLAAVLAAAPLTAAAQTAAHRAGPGAQGERRERPQGAQQGARHPRGEHAQLTPEQRQQMERVHQQ